MDLMAPSIRKSIIEGKDVNLASLLIPYYDLASNKPDGEGKLQEDVRLKRLFSLSEFITAFGRYKRTMCQVYPNRREELDQYEACIISIHNN